MLLGILSCALLVTQPPITDKVGDKTSKGTLVPTGQYVKPVGERLALTGRPVDLVVSPDGRYAYAKHNSGLVSIDVRTWKVIQSLDISGGSSWYGLAINPTGTKLLHTNSANRLTVLTLASGRMTVSQNITLPNARVGGNPFPTGVAFSPDQQSALVCLNRDNSVAIVPFNGAAIQKVDVGIAPYAVRVDGNFAYVTAWSEKPWTSAKTAQSSGTQVPVDAKGVGTNGFLSKVDLNTKTVARSAKLPLQPCEIVSHGGKLYVPAANADVVSSLNPETLTRQDIPARLGNIYGSAPQSVAIDAAKNRMWVALGAQNKVIAIQLSSGKIEGEFPTDWYPSAVRIAGEHLLVTCAKGEGSRNKPAGAQGYGVYQFTGSVLKVPRSIRLAKPAEGIVQLQAREKIAPRAIPERPGEPSQIEHVLYIIKENRTYDQVFGDMPEGDGEPKLCIFGEEITPNHHALARRYPLLDNYYCNGVLSADGHTWATEGNTTTQLERSFGGWTRSYPFGDDPLAVSKPGYIWNQVLAVGKTFRNYGEFDYAGIQPSGSFLDVYRDFISNGGKYTFTQNIGVEMMRRYAAPGVPGWNMGIPDVLRADRFIKDFKQLEARNAVPNFMILYLPQDHTSGGATGMPTPRAHMADNDLALGRVVEAISKSSIWSKTAIFVNEDDPQAGFDHVDGHRSLCLVISPYTYGKRTVSTFYNQVSVLRTIAQIFGAKPVNAFDSVTAPMFDLFHESPNLATYTALPNRVPLDEINGGTVPSVNLSKPDLLDEDFFNRQIWAAVRPGEPYPAEWAGPHGRGLAAKGLKLDPSGVQEDDD